MNTAEDAATWIRAQPLTDGCPIDKKTGRLLTLKGRYLAFMIYCLKRRDTYMDSMQLAQDAYVIFSRRFKRVLDTAAQESYTGGDHDGASGQQRQ